MRWAELLKQYKFKILYILKKENNRVDILNRRENLIEREPTNRTILKKNKNEFLLFIK